MEFLSLVMAYFEIVIAYFIAYFRNDNKYFCPVLYDQVYNNYIYTGYRGFGSAMFQAEILDVRLDTSVARMDKIGNHPTSDLSTVLKWVLSYSLVNLHLSIGHLHLKIFQKKLRELIKYS